MLILIPAGILVLLLWSLKVSGASVTAARPNSPVPAGNVLSPGTMPTMKAAGMNFMWTSQVAVHTIDNDTDPFAPQISYLPNGATSGTIVLTKPGINDFTVYFAGGKQGKLSVSS